MLTLTVRHNRKDKLKDLLEAMEQAYTNIQATGAFKDLRNNHRAKFVRVLEVTHGKNGFHPHFHIAIIHDKDAIVTSYTSELQDTWVRFIVSKGLKAPIPEVAVHIVANCDPAQRAWYLTKASGISSLEFSSRDSKEAAAGNLGIWQIHALAVDGDLSARKIWLEYENAIMRKRLISPSRGMAEFFGISWQGDKEIEVSEYQSANTLSADKLQIVNPDIALCGVITTRTWNEIRARRLILPLRKAISRGEAVKDFLEAHNVSGFVLSLEQLEEMAKDRPFYQEMADEALLMGNRNIAERMFNKIKQSYLIEEVNLAMEKSSTMQFQEESA